MSENREGSHATLRGAKLEKHVSETRGSGATTETILQKLRYVADGLRCRVSVSLVRRVKYGMCECLADGC
jgi:hypothetical protein